MVKFHTSLTFTLPSVVLHTTVYYTFELDDTHKVNFKSQLYYNYTINYSFTLGGSQTKSNSDQTAFTKAKLYIILGIGWDRQS